MNDFKDVGLQSIINSWDEQFNEGTLMVKAKPFVKWVGGKTQLLKTLVAQTPLKFENYFEPFVGGGALFFKLNSLGRIKKQAYLNDGNKNLITVYEAIKTKPHELIEELSSGKYQNTEETFYKIRSEEPKDRLQQAARFIYLNKTAFNGLYRVNLKGKFNVPFGRYRNPAILDAKNLLAASKTLENVELACLDFEEAVMKAKEDDFIYFDPPYHPLSKTSSFTSYTANNFTVNDQTRLFKCFERLKRRGCKLLLSNSYTPLIHELYKEHELETVMANRAINCKGNERGKIKEVLITT